MKTPFDWISMGLFCVLTLLFIHRSSSPRQTDRIISYLPPAIGCGGANYLGNHGHYVWAGVLVFVIAGYVWVVLKPLSRDG